MPCTIKIGIKVMWYEDVSWTLLAQRQEQVTDSVENGNNKPSGFIKGGQIS